MMSFVDEVRSKKQRHRNQTADGAFKGTFLLRVLAEGNLPIEADTFGGLTI